ncbi:MAG: TetR/AcrR family transcriptional regulator [Lachnospiraceae bacterium]
MPTERFARLPAEKKEVIRKAAVSEFTRVPFEKVSINQIIQNADISRGSFYTYFEDKRDLLQYVFSDILMQAHEFCRESLIRNEGNYWKMLDELFLDWFQFKWSENLMELARIALFQTEAEQLIQCDELEMMGGTPEGGEWLYKNGDWSELRCQDRESIRLVTDLGVQTLIMSLGQRMKFPEKTEEIYQMFTEKLNIIRRGSCIPKAD